MYGGEKPPVTNLFSAIFFGKPHVTPFLKTFARLGAHLVEQIILVTYLTPFETFYDLPWKSKTIKITHSANGPWKKKMNFIFPTKYVIPKSLKFSHWLSEIIVPYFGWLKFPTKTIVFGENLFFQWSLDF